MGSKYKFQQVISNAFLQETKVIVATTNVELQHKAAQQYEKWSEQEAKKRNQASLLVLEMQAGRNTQEAQARLDALRNLVHHGIRIEKRFRWENEKDSRQFPPFEFKELPPTYEQAAQMMGLSPQRSMIATVFPGSKKKRDLEEVAIRAMQQRLHGQYEVHRADMSRGYEGKRREFEQGRAQFNTSIDENKRKFEAGDTEVVEWFLKRIIEGIHFPEGYGNDFELMFEPLSGIAVISMQLPSVVEIPHISSYRFVKGRAAIDPVEMKPKELDALYDSFIYQMTLLTIYMCFREADTPALSSIVFNGWVTGINRSTGHEFASCILSVQAARKDFEAINLDRVDPKECIRNLKGLVAGPLSQQAPVRPVMDLDTFDKRFVESREVLAQLNSTDNLATMDWEDFEHLVRELFGKVFAGYGSEVRVTQASRDGGVDAIAFDPDPIRGGKFVIQAKRYTKVVPVSAVRDLYGTMINEGAVKGILVTTSYYGNDSREFVKDKPITLLDGANLSYMFQQHGYNVRIDIQQQTR